MTRNILIAAAAMLASVLLADEAAHASCVSQSEILRGAAANFTGHVAQTRRAGGRDEATIIVDSVRSGPVRVGQRVGVTGTQPSSPDFAGTLRPTERFRFLPQESRRPFAVNECLSRRLHGVVVPARTVVEEQNPWWPWPALVVALAAGFVAGRVVWPRGASTPS